MRRCHGTNRGQGAVTSAAGVRRVVHTLGSGRRMDASRLAGETRPSAAFEATDRDRRWLALAASKYALRQAQNCKPMSALGQKQTYAMQNGMSALPSKADTSAIASDNATYRT